MAMPAFAPPDRPDDCWFKTAEFTPDDDAAEAGTDSDGVVEPPFVDGGVDRLPAVAGVDCSSDVAGVVATC